MLGAGCGCGGGAVTGELQSRSLQSAITQPVPPLGSPAALRLVSYQTSLPVVRGPSITITVQLSSGTWVWAR